MTLNNQKELENNMGEIISEGLKNPIVRQYCMQGKNMSYEEIKKMQGEFSRFIGYCILFRSSQDIGNYMLLGGIEKQKKFLSNKIAKELGISEMEKEKRKNEIIEYAYLNFKKKGYVFHAANSASVKMKMNVGLSENKNIEQQKGLCSIEAIYRKYDSNCPYSPLGHGATDIIDNKTGWFFDGFPIHSTGYANSPQWFNYLCGKSYVYFESIPEEKRNGYANRDYETSLEAIIWLIKNRNMSIEDRKHFLQFFQKCWNEYKDTTPCLMFVPVEEVGVNDEIKFEQYLNDDGLDLLLNDIISGKVNPGKNYCCKKTISPEKLSYVDLSPILPKFKIERNNEVINKNVNVSNQLTNINEEER